MNEAILVVEDEQDMRVGLCKMLSREGYEVDGVGTGDDALHILETSVFDIVITDLKLPGPDGIEVLRKLREVSPESQGIVITGYSTVESAVEAMKLGAYDYISKPFNLQKVKVLVKNALEQSNLIRQNRYLKKRIDTQWQVDHIVGKSAAMEKVIRAAEKVAPGDTNVLVLGESGTGKELVARLIHHRSTRSDALFMPINCAVLREAFLESELFGHAKGAFTGAVSAKRGLLEVAHGGTFFLDEIADVSLAVQAKLLRVLEDRSFMRLGSTETIRTNIRLIAATNKDLHACMRDGSFREDLYYRLNVFQICVPPLRERREDIASLAFHFLEKHNRRLGKSIEGLSPEALQALTYYDWRGNVRELENAIEGGVILAEGNVLRSHDLPTRILAGEFENVSEPEAVPYSEAKRKLNDQFNKMYVQRVLARNNGNVTHAAKEAGMNRANFQRLMRNAGVKPAN